MLKLMLLAPVYLETSQDSLGEELNVILTEKQTVWIVMPESETKIEPSLDARFATHATRVARLDPLSSLPPQLDRCYFNFPFLTHSQTFAYLQSPECKVMFIMRGLSGSGKSSIVSLIKSSFRNVVVCSADDYFYREDGNYQFDEKLLKAAHEECQNNAKVSCESGVPIVVIDNTNVRRWELKFYFELARKSGHIVVLVQPKTPWRRNAEELAARNEHRVSVELMQRKIKQFDDIVPNYYGWFLSEKRSQSLTRLCKNIFLQCLSKLPKLRQDILQDFGVQLDKTNEEAAQKLFSVIYSNDNTSRTRLLHCTAKFCARGKAPNAQNYHNRADVQQACGQMFVLGITGLVITRRTLGVRVTLNSPASVLFDRPEENEWEPQHERSSQRFGILRKNVVVDSLVKDSLIIERTNRKTKKNEHKFLKQQQKKQGNVSRKNGRFIPGENITNEKDVGAQKRNAESDQFENSGAECSLTETMSMQKHLVRLLNLFPALRFCGKLRSAHITIRTAKGVESKEVNFDLLRVCDLETSFFYNMADFVDVSRGLAYYYGDGLCCVYFRKPLQVPTLFSGYY